MASPKLWKLAAIPLGLALAGVPAAAVHTWLSHYIEQEGVNELNVSAKRVIALTETRLGRVIEGLDDLAARGVRSCVDADRDAMHEMSFRVIPVKEVSMVDSDGGTVCTNLALPFGQRQVISAPIESRHSEIVIEVIRLGEWQRQRLAHPPHHRGRLMARRAHPVRSADPAHFADRRSGRRQRDARDG